MQLRSGMLSFSVLGLTLLSLVASAPAGAAGNPNPLWYANGKRLDAAPRTPVVLDGREFAIESPVFGELLCKFDGYEEVWNQTFGSQVRGVGEVVGFNTTKCTTGSGKAAKASPLFITAEPPLEASAQEAEVCNEKTKLLAECTEPSERKTVSLVTAARRSHSSLPWNFELTREVREAEMRQFQVTGRHALGEPFSESEQIAAAGTCYPKQAGAPASWTAVPSGCIVINVVDPQIPAEVAFYGTLTIEAVNGAKVGLLPTNLQFDEEESGPLSSSEGVAGEKTYPFGEAYAIGVNQIELITAK